MAFSLIGVLAVLFELVRPLLPVLAVIALVEIGIIALLLVKRGSWRVRVAIQAAVGIGAVACMTGLFGMLAYTGATHTNLHGLLDYGFLLLAGVGTGLLAGLLSYPPLQLLFRNPARLPLGLPTRP